MRLRSFELARNARLVVRLKSSTGSLNTLVRQIILGNENTSRPRNIIVLPLHSPHPCSPLRARCIHGCALLLFILLDADVFSLTLVPMKDIEERHDLPVLRVSTTNCKSRELENIFQD
jgi:hypothetical protein